MIDPIATGPPGLYFAPPRAHRVLDGVPMDACAFVGIAPRGPAWVPVHDGRWGAWHAALAPGRPRARSVAIRVESIAEYRQIFGGFDGPGRLPYAVQAFFSQGGRVAWIVRIVPRAGDGDAGAAWHALGGLTDGSLDPVRVRARSEGRWGDALTVRIDWRVHPVPLPEAIDANRITLDLDEPLPMGSLLRVHVPGHGVALRWALPAAPESDLLRVLRFDAPLAAAPDRIERLEIDLRVDDGAGRIERWAGLGLAPEHPRWLGRVIDTESALIFADPQWFARRLQPTVFDPLEEAHGALTTPGVDRYPLVALDDFFAPLTWQPDEDPGDGIQAALLEPSIASITVPDLYVPGPLPPSDAVLVSPGMAGPAFAPCVEVSTATREGDAEDPPPQLDLLHLDPALPADRAQIIAQQQALADLAAQARIVALLDVPPGLALPDVLAWRRHFRTAWAAAYHGWLTLAVPDDGRDALIRVNPAAVAAGIIASQELTRGIAWGPANVVVADAVAVDAQVDFAWHGRLHHEGVNVFAAAPDGIRLTGARTLSPRHAWRQLSVRRIMAMLARTIEQQMQWLAFEPNNAATRATISRLLRGLLRDLHRANTFRGATEAEAFFVRCDASLNPEYVVDSGRLIAEIGVAPAEPAEFIVVRLERGPDADLRVEA